MAASIEELSYQLTADALAEQERALNALRGRRHVRDEEVGPTRVLAG